VVLEVLVPQPVMTNTTINRTASGTITFFTFSSLKFNYQPS
jgi:hypothetical protein